MKNKDLSPKIELQNKLNEFNKYIDLLENTQSFNEDKFKSKINEIKIALEKNKINHK
jgi:hypothetical protein